jgi:predicted Zn-dependent protease
MPMCNDPKVDAYLSKLGHRLIEHLNTRGVEYPWEFHCVNDKAVNAFALPVGLYLSTAVPLKLRIMKRSLRP